jgi:hypothetical protein
MSDDDSVGYEMLVECPDCSAKLLVKDEGEEYSVHSVESVWISSVSMKPWNKVRVYENTLMLLPYLCPTCSWTGECDCCAGGGWLGGAETQEIIHDCDGVPYFLLSDGDVTFYRCVACGGSGYCPDCKEKRIVMNWYYLTWTSVTGNTAQSLYIQAESFSEAVKRIEEKEGGLLGRIDLLEQVDGPPYEDEPEL